MHEQSETVQRPDGKWVNVYGANTPQAGQQLPDTPTFDTVDAAVNAAKQRSQDYGHDHPEPAPAPAAPAPAPAPAPRSFLDDLFRKAEQDNQLPAGTLAKIAGIESSFRPDAIGPVTRTGKRAQGLMQFMPDTAKQYGIDPLDPKQAVPAAGKHIAYLRDLFGGSMEKAIAAYNWGEGNVQRRGLEKMPAETRAYLNKFFAGPQPAAAAPAPTPTPTPTWTPMQPRRKAPSMDEIRRSLLSVIKPLPGE